MYLEKEIERLIDVAIKEDIASGDITSNTLIPSDYITSGSFVLKQAGVLSALVFLKTLFQKIDPKIDVTLYVEEGSYHKAGTIIARVSGSARGIIAGERVALNLIQHASGISTATYSYVKKLRGLTCAILDTRKTLPGLRALEKYAVYAGGGTNHRFTLDDLLTIKSNHLHFLSDRTKTPIERAVKKVKAFKPDLTVEVEISSLSQLTSALKTDAEAIMLSRMIPSDIRKCVIEIRKTNKKVFIESLGTITLDTIRAYAETGVDGISIGSITHSVPSLDIVMRLK